jgi:hypothetical protein
MMDDDGAVDEGGAFIHHGGASSIIDTKAF